MSPATITTRGTATAPARPDRVVLQIEVSALSKSPGEAIEETARRSQAVDAILDDLRVPEEARTTSGVTVGEETEYDGRREVHRGYRARDSVRAKLSDRSPLGELIRRAAEEASARISGPWWSVDDHNPARLDACKGAALMARERATAYVAALGMRLGALVEAVEAGARPPEAMQPQAMRTSGRTLAGTAAAEVEVHPGEMEVSATIDLTFNVEEA